MDEPPAAQPPFEHRPFMPDDTFAAEHADVTAWVEASLASLPDHAYYRAVDLQSLASGRTLLAADATKCRKYVMVAVAQVQHWDAEAARIRTTATSEFDRMNAHTLPGWPRVWGRRRQAYAVVVALLRRKLPFNADDVLKLVDWAAGQAVISTYHVPITSLVKTVARHAGEVAPTETLRAALRALAAKLRASSDKDAHRVGTVVEQLFAAVAPENGKLVDADPATLATAARPLVPVTAGDARVHARLKRLLGLTTTAAPETAESIGRDAFPLLPGSPLATQHSKLNDLLAERFSRDHLEIPLSHTVNGKAALAAGHHERGLLLLATTERIIATLIAHADSDDMLRYRARAILVRVVTDLSDTGIALERDGLFDLMLFLAATDQNTPVATAWAINEIERLPADAPLTDGERYTLHLLRLATIGGPPLGHPDDTVLALTNFIGDRANFWLVPGEAWTDAANAEIAALPAAEQAAWTALWRHLLTASAARPSGAWLKKAGVLIDAVGRESVAAAAGRWFALVSRRGTARRVNFYVGDRTAGDIMHAENATALRGLLWIVPVLGAPSLTHALTGVAVDGYRKLPGIGIRSPKVGNAAIYALSCLGTDAAIGQLAVLKSRLKGGVQKEIEKAFDAAAAKLGLPRERIEEMAVPTYGLTEVGRLVESFGDFTAELRVNGSDVKIAWTDAKNKTLKSVPAKVKADHKDAWKELQLAAKDIAAMLPAQRDRIDGLFLTQKRWAAGDWRECYLDHSLIGTIARRLIWTLHTASGAHDVIWHDGRLVDVNDQPIDASDDVEVTLWHSIGRPADVVAAWRAWLVRHEIRQPFKQAHREVYPLTDAEQRTETYSNRFAAHVLRQHQFNALCAARGWRNKLRLLVDDTYPPATRELPQWGLRAEFWIEGVGDDYGVDTADSGAFLRVVTDQVRFYAIAAARTTAHAGGGGYAVQAHDAGAGGIHTPLPLERVPALVLSEVMRDVDLFVGVASVGNDPTWQDGGPGGRFLTYWQGYSFGDLSETAKTRRDVLVGLLPRLTKLRDRWTLDDKFLVIRGTKRVYKIHLGSGNILMEPNDQYLCIVPDRSAATRGGDVFLPFEGDVTLSIILSKAFLLAADDRITDPTIARQIGTA